MPRPLSASQRSRRLFSPPATLLGSPRRDRDWGHSGLIESDAYAVRTASAPPLIAHWPWHVAASGPRRRRWRRPAAPWLRSGSPRTDGMAEVPASRVMSATSLVRNDWVPIATVLRKRGYET